MRQALELARRGEGFVEPNPMVGAVIVADGVTIGSGWHERFGGPHAEAAALAAAGERARGATLFVTLEPCCHHGKTPPCTDAIIAAGIARVVVAVGDPFPEVAGRGLDALRSAGIAVETGLCREQASRLVAPFGKLVATGSPWVIAKWAMSLDGHVTPPAGSDRWISSEPSRALVHDLRGRCDAILVGIGTALADDPLLTVRPPGPRVPLRIVLDGTARLSVDSRLVRSAREAPLLVAVGPHAPAERIARLQKAGCEAWRSESSDRDVRLAALLAELGRRRLTNLLVEGGPEVLGSFASLGAIDEVWAFVAPRLLGGETPSAVTGHGRAAAELARSIDIEHVSNPGGDILIRGLVRRA
ncbi:MAG: bifunctional diaminohydroxyphosphoribosylaminopyrimidine deaminase/5-amino-6-(5-phosphoribosylamino)uracil reductase RibD [Planctomycetia bacterium]|nr:bifunctional diaminohydroxyphosphoribosylaminopyrimidine deaminase/5-amino-6-(5-phosphoribosylamino)uracil reductase RibD [Planctomycetia bacterium]